MAVCGVWFNYCKLMFIQCLNIFDIRYTNNIFQSMMSVSEMSTGIVHQITFLYLISNLQWDVHFKSYFFTRWSNSNWRFAEETSATGGWIHRARSALQKPLTVSEILRDLPTIYCNIYIYTYILYGFPQKRFNSNWLIYDYVTTIL